MFWEHDVEGSRPFTPTISNEVSSIPTGRFISREHYMKHINFLDLVVELKQKNISEFCKELKKRNGYDAIARKKRLNPEEYRLMFPK